MALAVMTTGSAALASSEQSALLINPSEEARAELQRVISAALHGAPVRLAGDALTRDSVVTIDRVEPRTPDGTPFDGRQVGQRSQHFRLVRDGAHCFLIQQETGKHWSLHRVTCKPSA